MPNDTEAAYSNYIVFQHLGCASVFGYSSFLCTDVKLYIMFGTLIVTYFCLELQQRIDPGSSFSVTEKEGSSQREIDSLPMKKKLTDIRHFLCKM